MSDIAIGPSAGTLYYFLETGPLEKVPPPRTLLIEGAELVEVASGYTRWIGYPRIIWHWDYLELEWYDALRAICPLDSDEIFIRSSTNRSLDEIQVFICIYSWPLELEKDFKVRRDFELTFKRAVELSVSSQPDSAMITLGVPSLSVITGGTTRLLDPAILYLEPGALHVSLTPHLNEADLSVTGQTLTVVLS